MEKTNPTRQQQAQRMIDIFRTARQRYLNAGGDPRRSAGSLNDNDHLTDDERKEVKELGEKIFDAEYINNYLQQRQHNYQMSQKKSQALDET